MEKKTWTWIAIAFVAMLAITISAGIYIQGVGVSEMVHFRVAVPAGNITGPVVLRGAGPTVEMAPVTIDLDKRGLVKEMINPGIEGISTHWITNTGKKPVRIRMDFLDLTIPVRWEVSANLPYDPATRTFLEPLNPGQSIQNLGIDWIFEIPRDQLYEPVIYQGGLVFEDAETGEVLTYLPVIIGRGVGEGGDAACH
jgi:hypothetical protein